MKFEVYLRKTRNHRGGSEASRRSIPFGGSRRKRVAAWLVRTSAALAFVGLVLGPISASWAQSTNESSAIPGWISQPLALSDALQIALEKNANVLKAAKDIEAQHGVSMQTKSIVLPKLEVTGGYQAIQQAKVETFGSSAFSVVPSDQSWNVGVRVIQSLYEGGRMWSSLRSARLIREQAVLNYQTVVADTILNVREFYYDALLATNLILVRQASLELLNKQLEDTKSRFDAGVVPQFDVLRAEVELANAKPPLIKARNDFRISKQRLANELGYDVPGDILEDLPLHLTDKLQAIPYKIDLQMALIQAIENRTELAALRKGEALRKEGIVTAKAGYKPSLQVYAGYGTRSRQFGDDLSAELHGWEAGAQVDWFLFDGLLSQGKVKEARALREKAQLDLGDATRRITLEVRALYSTFIESKEVLESQQKVNEQAVEALRLAKSRYDAGTGTQLDVLSAQTALTDARTTYVVALRDYSAALARLERAIGANLAVEVESKADALEKP